MAEESLQNDFFDTEYLKADLKGRSVRGGAVTMAAQGARFFLQMGSTIVLARLLTPQDFGLIAMVTAVTGFVMMFKDMGLSMATVQRATIDHRQISTLFWINVILSFCIMLVTAALAPGIAWLYGEPRLTWITLALAGAFIFGGLTVQHQALLRRQMRFGALALVEIISMSVGIAAAIITASYGAGYWSLVVMQLARAISIAVAVWFACDWRPGLPQRRAGVRKMLSFGGNLTASQMLIYIVRHLDKVLLGAVWGAGPLGLYSKAYQLLLLPIQQVNQPLAQVAIPALSRLQHEPNSYRRYYCKGLAFLAMCSMPIVVFALVAADNLILLVLGKQWLQAIPLFRALAPAALIGTLNMATGWVFVPLGRTDKQLRAACFGSIVTITAFCIGLRWGALGVAVAFSSAVLIVRLPQIIYAYHGTPLRLIDLGSVLWRPALACLIAAAAVIGVDVNVSVTNLFLRLLVQGIIFISCYGAIWLIVPGGRDFLREIVDLAKTFRHGGSSNRVFGSPATV